MRILYVCWKSWFAFCFIVIFLILFPFFWIALRLGCISFAYKLKTIWAYLSCYLTGIFPVVRRERSFRWPPKAIIVANHTSYLDIVLVPFFCKTTAIFMAKMELLKVPLFNIFFRYMDIPVNRKSITHAHKAFIRASEELKKNRNVIIFPEGTISPDGILKPFKDGAFLLAIQERVPIIPVVYRRNWQYLHNGGFLKARAHPGFPEIFVGKPFVTRNLHENDAEQLKETIRNFMIQKLGEKTWK